MLPSERAEESDELSDITDASDIAVSEGVSPLSAEEPDEEGFDLYHASLFSSFERISVKTSLNLSTSSSSITMALSIIS